MHILTRLIGLLTGLLIGLFPGLLIHSLDWSLDWSVFLVADTNSIRGFVHALVHLSVGDARVENAKNAFTFYFL